MRNYKYHNQNPNKRRTTDCVCRAISTATGLSYEAVNNLLEMTADTYRCDKLCVCCYHNLLEDVLCYPRNNCDFAKTVAEVAAEHPRNTVIIRVHEHLTSAVNGTLLDIWDCSDELVDCFWITH